MIQRGFKRAIGALALVASLGLAGVADAAYTYSTSIMINSVSGSGGTIVNTPGSGATFTSTSGTSIQFQDILTPGQFLVGGPLSANIGNVGVVPTNATPDSFSLAYTDVITFTNGGQTGTFTVTGTLTAANLAASGGAFGGTVSNLYNPPFNQGPLIVGGASFTANFGTGAANDFFGPPTIGQPAGATGSGSLGGLISSSAVPEPASMAMVGLGLAGAGVASALRRRRLA